MAADLPPIRGPVLTDADRAWLERLRSFRHFFRHAYAVQLDASKLIEHAGAVQAGHGSLLAQIDGLIAHVAAVLGRLGE